MGSFSFKGSLIDDYKCDEITVSCLFLLRPDSKGSIETHFIVPRTVLFAVKSTYKHARACNSHLNTIENSENSKMSVNSRLKEF